MPGRTSTRTAGSAPSSAAAPRKRPSSRASTANVNSEAVEVPDEGEANDLRTELSRVFAKAQKSTAVQRKLASDLRKVHEACCYDGVKPATLAAMWKDFGESEFNEEFARCVLRVLAVKKSEGVGDRVVRFMGVFLKFASDKDNAIVAATEGDTTDVMLETPSSRLTSAILSLLLPLLNAKDRVIRFRCTQIIAHIINTLDSIDSELFPHIRLGLLKRLRDKEAAVRVQAVLGLGRLADTDESDQDDESNSDSDEDSSGAHGVLQKLVESLQHDPSAEVRRSLLLNLPFTPSTLPYLLERARDVDAATRRALYSRLLPALGDFRHLSLTHREKLLRWGLRDRDDNVRRATARLFRERWIEDCAGSRDTEDAEKTDTDATDQNQLQQQQAAKPSMDALLELLERIDVINSGVETGIAHEAAQEFWDGRPDYLDYMNFNEAFWEDLTAESAFVARSFNQYCRKGGLSGHVTNGRLQEMVEDRMPEVTKFAFLLQKHLNKLIVGVRRVALLDEEDNEEANADAEEDTVQQEFCVEQLLQIALTLDYSDEVGRRAMFSIMREALAQAELPEECTKLCIEVLRAVCGPSPASEREFCGIVLEAVAEVHDTIMGEEGETQDAANDSFHSARSEVSGQSTPTQKKSKGNQKRGASVNIDGDDVDGEEGEEVDEEKAIREIMVNMKCLHIAQCMLQNVQCELEQNSDLVTMLNNLVVPAVRSQEAPIRERGLTCLGLCCLLSKNLAAENLSLFLHCFAKGHDALQAIALQIITDIVISHPSLLSVNPPPAIQATLAPPSPSKRSPTKSSSGSPTNPLLKPLQKTYLRALKSADASVQTMGAISLSKLLLSRSLPASPPSLTSDLLKHLTFAYFDPDTAVNPALRQALAYSLPAYAQSRTPNAEAMAKVAVAVVHSLAAVRAEWADEVEAEDEGARNMVGLTSVGAALVDWTDPRKAMGFEERKRNAEVPNDPDVNTNGAPLEAKGIAHLILAEECLERLLTAGTTKDEKKTLVSMISKLHIPALLSPSSSSSAPTTALVNLAENGGKDSDATLELARSVLALAEEALDSKKVVGEGAGAAATARNAVMKLKAAVEKAVGALEEREEQGKRSASVVTAIKEEEGEEECAKAGAAAAAADVGLSDVEEEEEELEESRVDGGEEEEEEGDETMGDESSA